MTATVLAPLDADRQALAARYLPLAVKLARPFGRSRPWLADDYESVACIALVRAAATYDPARARFMTWAHRLIRLALLDLHRVETRRIEHVESLGGIDTPDPTTPQTAALDEDDAFERLLRSLPSRQREIARLIYRDGLNCTEVADLFDLSKSRIHTLHHRILATLRESAA